MVRNMITKYGYARIIADKRYMRKSGRDITEQRRGSKLYTQLFIEAMHEQREGGYLTSNKLMATKQERMNAFKNRSKASVSDDSEKTKSSLTKFNDGLQQAINTLKSGDKKGAAESMVSLLDNMSLHSI